MDAASLARAMGCSPTVADRFVADMNVAMLQARCTTVRRAAMWCAQVGHESAGLQYMEEIASGAAYEGRRDLGNVAPGDGRRFKGRGPIQLTGRTNYGAFGRWCADRGLAAADAFLRDPASVATSQWGFLAAAWYWTVARPKLNAAADAADVLLASQMINGFVAKPNGLADRQRRWDVCLQLGAALLPSGHPDAADPGSARRRRSLLLNPEEDVVKIVFYTDQDCTKPDPAGLYWRGLKTAEVGDDSAAVATAWVRWRAAWGGSSFKIVAWDETHPLAEPDYRKDYWPLPPQTRSFTAEGRRDHPGVVIDVTLLQLGK